MSVVKFKWPTLARVLGVTALLVSPGVGAGDQEPTWKSAHVSKLDLTPESVPGLLGLIRPQESEWRHLRVQWMTDVVAARKLAAKDDKPIVVLYTGGAGYNGSVSRVMSGSSSKKMTSSRQNS